MRILIITDSLGLPRKEVYYKDVWTDKFLNEVKNIGNGDTVVYTILRRSLTIEQVWKMRGDIGFICPDIIIFQFGIVDSSRRVLSEDLQYYLTKFPRKVQNLIRKFITKHHYFLTKLYCVRYNSPQKFKNYMKDLVDWLEARPRYYAFIKIASPGEILQKKTYDIENDVKKYNQIIFETIKKQGIFLDPYGSLEADKYVLKEDGHHLSAEGAELVYHKVISWISELFKC